MTAPLGVEDQYQVADFKDAGGHVQPCAWRVSFAAPAARACNRQNAQSSPVVGAPQVRHSLSDTRSASDATAKCGCARSRKPKRNDAFEPGERSSSALSSSL